MNCEQCSAAFDGRAGQRFCARTCRNAYWNAVYDARPREPRAPRAPRAGARRSGRRSNAPVGTQTWLTDSTIKVCAQDGCHFDLGTCAHKS